MKKEEVYGHIDHTLLKAFSTTEQIEAIAEEALKYGTASICIPASFVNYIHNKYKDVNICTVIGFPLGYSTTSIKVAEAKQAIEDGANEIDMVINLGHVKDQRFDLIEQEIREIKAACGDKILKVIIETCLLTEEEKIKMCEVVTNAKADYIKTSTGFSTSGATFEDVALFAKHVGEHVQIKAAGGISSFDDAQKFIELGANRLGTSRLVKIMNNEQVSSNTY